MTAASISVGKIRTDGGTQPRAELSAETIAEYREAMAAGSAFPPVVVFYDGTDHWLADGFHRLEATKATGAKEIAADVRQGTQRDAVLFSAGANAAHGLRRTNADKRRAVERLLADKEWSKWSDRKIAEACGVTHPFVGKLRAERASGNGYHPEDELGKWRVHPAGMVFPWMTSKELDGLTESIRAHGLHMPIDLYGGEILDGKCRLVACLRAGVKPRFRVVPEDANPWEWVWSMNALRYQYTGDQKAAIYIQAQKLMDAEKKA